MRMPAMVSSNSRDQAARPVTSFSCSSFSSSSDSSCGRNTRRSRSQGRQRASAGSASFGSSADGFQPVQLQGEEQQLGRDGGDPLVHRLVEAADRRVVRIAAEQKLRVRHRPAEHFLDALVVGDGRGQGGAGVRAQLAGVAGGEGAGVGLGAVEVAGECRDCRATGRGRAGPSSAARTPPSRGGAAGRRWRRACGGFVLSIWSRGQT